MASQRERNVSIMHRIGIIGTENSHALAFAKLINLPDPRTGEYLYPDMRVVGVYGPDKDSEKQIMDEAKVDFIAPSPEAFFGKVDAMMVTCRKGSLHCGYAMPFVEKGMPVFIDKPFTCDTAEAAALVSAAKQHGALLTGGSGCKYAYDVLTLQNRAQTLRSEDKLLTGWINFAADKNSIYDGFYFYSPHLTEMVLTIFGYDMRAVRAFERESCVTVVARYDDFDVTMSFTKDTSDTNCIIVGKEHNYCRAIDISQIYAHEVARFAQMLREGIMPVSYDQLTRHTTVIGAIVQSMRTKEEIAID